ncbi:MAG: cell division protein ZapB [bacterium]|nr:cell division protein ZapB [bacterium]
MSDRLELLDKKVSQVLDRLESLKRDNASLKDENASLRSQLGQLQQDLDSMKLSQNDQADVIRSKLVSVLGRIEELEKSGL